MFDQPQSHPIQRSKGHAFAAFGMRQGRVRLADLAQADPVGISAIPEEDPNDLEAMDAAWEEAAVRFGPGEAMDGCGTDRLQTRLRAGARDAALA